MSVLKLNQIQTANGVIMANLNSSGANIGFQLASSLAPTFSAYRTTSQSITTSTWTKVQLNAEDWDNTSCFDSSTNYRFTPLVAGYYQINGGAYIEASGTITRIIVGVYKNGTLWKFGNYMGPVTADNLRGVAVVSTMVYLNGSTDYVELYGYSTATSPLFAGDSTGQQVFMNGFLARSA
jgi:hypothetical protein